MKSFSVVIDVSNSEALEKFEKLVEELEKVDVFVNESGQFECDDSKEDIVKN